MAAQKRGKRPAAPNPRQFLKAYLMTQELHKQIHRCTKAFEECSEDQEIIERLLDAQDLLAEILELVE